MDENLREQLSMFQKSSWLSNSPLNDLLNDLRAKMLPIESMKSVYGAAELLREQAVRQQELADQLSAFGKLASIPGPSAVSSAFMAAHSETIEQAKRWSGFQDAILSATTMPSLPTFPVGTFFDALPNMLQPIADFYRAIRESQDGREVLDEADFGFVANWVVLSYFADLAEIDDAKERTEAVESQMLDTTQSDDFEQKLLSRLAASSLLSRRSRLIKAGIDAHRDGSFHYSIPLLLAQLEGAIADTLILKNLVRRQGNKLILVDPVTGTDEMWPPETPGATQKPKEARGLCDLIARSKWAKDDAMRDVAVTLTGTLAKYRNGVLHGGDLDYDTPKRSSILLLMIYCIADEFAGFEEETS